MFYHPSFNSLLELSLLQLAQPGLVVHAHPNFQLPFGIISVTIPDLLVAEKQKEVFQLPFGIISLETR